MLSFGESYIAKNEDESSNKPIGGVWGGGGRERGRGGGGCWGFAEFGVEK